MQYALLIYEDEALYDDAKDADAAASEEIFGLHVAFGQSLGAARLGGWGLKSTATATTVRTSAGTKTIHDGPFAEAREQLGGLYVVDAPDLDAAIEMAKQVPLYRNGSIEVRPIIGPG